MMRLLRKSARVFTSVNVVETIQQSPELMVRFGGEPSDFLHIVTKVQKRTFRAIKYAVRVLPNVYLPEQLLPRPTLWLPHGLVS